MTSKPAFRPTSTTGFVCPVCGRPIMPSARLSYPPAAIGQFAPVYRCGCGRHIGEPIGMVQVVKK